MAAGATTAPPQDTGPFWANPSNMFLPLIVVMLVFFMYSSSRTKKQDQKKRDNMLANMKRGDRVMTVGGILGSVIEVRDAEVLLKVDEGSNTKIKFTRDAIKRVIAADDETAQSVK
jgi:preprotein translocase subunit YajC